MVKAVALTHGIMVRTGAQLADGQTKAKAVPGMAVDVDLLVGERTIRSYLTGRIFWVHAEAVRER